MKVVVFGAHGEIGEHVIKKLKQKKYQSLAVVGKEMQMEGAKNRGADETAVFEEMRMEDFLDGGCTVIYLSDVNQKAQSDKTVLIDHDGLEETVKKAKENGVHRFIMLSAVKAHENTEEPGNPSRIGGKHKADEYLRESGLNYTVILPGKLTDQPGTGKILVSEAGRGERDEISRDDIAAVLVEAIEIENVFNKTISVTAGKKEIAEALADF
ncbi:NAD(P)H-binding protein [Neobacillus terrae]|uniref:NAD(P)H-binding protein n=1 Tax=Neobacillus terrae TaxID=3034837 RepID=UPI0014082129|nr:NAD(P)H-binding protein [Neobacillus terrae]NHM32647.1 NAD(P)H-binding protein [Neobacillus terrae]